MALRLVLSSTARETKYGFVPFRARAAKSNSCCDPVLDLAFYYGERQGEARRPSTPGQGTSLRVQNRGAYLRGLHRLVRCDQAAQAQAWSSTPSTSRPILCGPLCPLRPPRLSWALANPAASGLAWRWAGAGRGACLAAPRWVRLGAVSTQSPPRTPRAAETDSFYRTVGVSLPLKISFSAGPICAVFA